MEPEDVVTFCQSDLPSTSFAAFADMRRNGELCDLTITVHDYSFTAHRVILAAAIPYFRSKFTGSEAGNENKEMCVDLDPETLGSLIDFAYSSRVNISAGNVRSLLQASHFLQLDQLLNSCVEFLTKRLRVNNVLQVHTLAHDLGNLDLFESCSIYIRENFEGVSKSEDFLSLPVSRVKEIISEDNLNVSCEEVVFEAVMNWTKVSPAKRQDMLLELLSEVRMIFLPGEYLVMRVDSEELVKTSVPCRDLVNEVKNYHLVKNKSLFPNLKMQPRQFQSTQEDIYAVCYSIISSECSVVCCDLVEEKWYNIKVLSDCSYLSNAVIVNKKIYVFLEETIQVLHLKTLEWEKLNTRHTAIDFTCISSYGNIIYLFGSDDDSFIHKIRCFNTVENNWMEPGLMKTGRWGAAAVTLEEFIYVTGGSSTSKCLSVVEKYSPSTNEWSGVAAMLTARRSHGCASMSGKIYVCAGWTDAGRSCTAEVYDPLGNTWNFISSMGINRSSLSLVSCNRKIYAFGGRVENGCSTQEVEVYDPESDQWRLSVLSVPKDFELAISNTPLRRF